MALSRQLAGGATEPQLPKYLVLGLMYSWKESGMLKLVPARIWTNAISP